MAHVREPKGEQEPVGIVISSGIRAEEPPCFTAYVWGPVPEPEMAASKEMAAA